MKKGCDFETLIDVVGNERERKKSERQERARYVKRKNAWIPTYRKYGYISLLFKFFFM